MYKISDLILELNDISDKIWFIQSSDVTERSDAGISLRLYIREDFFIQVFLGELSDSLYFALISGNQRIFGIDKECGEWHIHPYMNPHEHEPLNGSLEPKPLSTFLSRVEKLIFEHDLL